LEEDDIQQKLYLYQVLKSEEEVLEKHVEDILKAILEVRTAEETMKEIRNSKEMLSSLGGGVFSFTNLADGRHVLVDIGAGVLVKKPIEDAKIILDAKIRKFESAMRESNEKLAKIKKEISKIEPELEMILNRE